MARTYLQTTRRFGVIKPFWAAEDPINGILPQTVDFQKLARWLRKSIRRSLSRYRALERDADRRMKAKYRTRRSVFVGGITSIGFANVLESTKSTAHGTKITPWAPSHNRHGSFDADRDFFRGRTSRVPYWLRSTSRRRTAPTEVILGSNKPRCKSRFGSTFLGRHARNHADLRTRERAGTLGPGDKLSV